MSWFRRAPLIVLGMIAISAPIAQAASASSGGKCSAVQRSVQISPSGGLGRIEWGETLGAVLQRDEGVVSILGPGRDYLSPPRVIGRYEDDARDSFDGDLDFVDDRWLLYARQTHQFSKDGIHVLDLGDPRAPRLAFYQPQGGTLRIAHYNDGANSWVFSLDAIHGFVTNLFDRTTGALVPVNASPLPALKVGGPASAGLFIDRKDPMTGKPILYVSTGRTGVEMFDISNPADPVLLGSWDEVGLAEIEVQASKSKRTIYGATEYWFNKQLAPEVIVLDASDPASIKKTDRWSIKAAAEDTARVQGMTFMDGLLHVAHSNQGVVVFSPGGSVERRIRLNGKAQEGSAYVGAGSIAFDVEPYLLGLLISDAATGRLTYEYERDCSIVIVDWTHATVGAT
ncbi:MAG TPA: hypothetical protein VG408_03355 [Actinomycetota bacterium]|nr:hypothetical protein [Actinomycetota bacterium]